ncbi:MAG TPA: RusA family crossover junction endodeoxyribonuclease [Stellaceae bacterium]|jgi:Holliday junction resolvase RusA-like endonuclease
MSVEIEFPFEFVVEGTAVSAQTARAQSRRAWQARIIEASRSALPEGHFASEAPISITLYYFPAVPMPGDIDNIVKPILDAMTHHIYLDDHQVERLVVQKFEPERGHSFSLPTAILIDALNRPRPALYIRLSDNPLEDFAR